ncbi:Nicotinamide-nucleotide amidohydrolase PncC [Novipirellula aureliae]|uniref:Nicotinamide-nucleotide amidohydrolase PncC n=1 Tax=Novipirellula aureliae TaxID=2527966 RepID=A0A5C6DNS0_9BACT|nr:CinA family protein [Novipirellula aureliae]TWU38933.1 Nicotinamide-nucleotide amidohydrolase PncC [Novipirellula aureliae]
MEIEQRNLQPATQLAELLEATKTTIVFAESCTAGLVSATLAAVPGISKWLCGSAVVYREATKVGWLGVDEEQLKRHSAVSAEVTTELAVGVLNRTPEAKLAVAVTGHLGPNAPSIQDGVIFIAVRRRDDSVQDVVSTRFQLSSVDRVDRQHEAADRVIAAAIAAMVVV